jgi:hypothetical protein
MVCRDHGINDDCGCLIEIELGPVESGVLSYSSRNRPNVKASWYFEHDEAWWRRGPRDRTSRAGGLRDRHDPAAPVRRQAVERDSPASGARTRRTPASLTTRPA